MNGAERAWRRLRGGELLAELVVTGVGFPWLNADVRPAAGFAEEYLVSASNRGFRRLVAME